MTTKHTPSPWLVRWGTQQRAGQQQAVNRCVIGTPKNEYGGSFTVAEIQGPFLSALGVVEANARLIAAAPDLLNMLQRMVDETAGGGTPCLLTLEHARAELAKAKGEA